MRSTAATLALLVTASLASPGFGRAATWEDVVTSSSFGGYGALESEWNYRYPWGSDHNGSSGSPGPGGDTVYRARNVYIGRTRA
ncbi:MULTISPECIES: hypothetical protein [unclassified Crossiella]|uniref:hypothetical protein n=1 Tax=unclassified Crossiella TaxID=2620835 RepID=UPI001FFE7443|nr:MULTISPECIES: hypothetical protein [unclassified Crossiella]MCK2244969.1 hypothetical protein [Crossiella sp. S99.2]MCK2258694.1 hypothetical protein [Crossiella sp. S99.1]